MNDGARTELYDLLKRFLDEPAAAQAAADIEAGERLLETYATPTPDSGLLRLLKAEMAVVVRRKRRRVRIVRASLASAAAVIAVAMAALLGPGTGAPPATTYAGILPHAIWESDNVAADDLDLAYYSSEVRLIEAEMEDLEAGEGEISGRVLDDLEREWMQIETEFWKG